MATAIITETHAATLQTLMQWLQRAGIDISNTLPLHAWYDSVKSEKPELCFLNAAQAFADKAFEQKARLVRNDTMLLLVCPERELPAVFSRYGEHVFDIITYPINLARIALTVRNALQVIAHRYEKPADEDVEKWSEWLPGNSDNMNKLREKAMLLAQSNAHVLITGDTGTGKGLLAEQMHAFSPRAAKKLVSINCMQYPLVILQNLLFGAENNAQNPSLEPAIDDARGSTLILDNIEALAAPLQQRLLYALVNTHPDVRVVSTATPALFLALDQHRFLPGLYNLLSSALLHVPSINERLSDIPALVHRYAEAWARQWHTPVKNFTAAAIHTLQQLPWPYNIRELKNSVERLILLGGNPVTDKDVRELLIHHSERKDNVLYDIFERHTQLGDLKSYIEEEYVRFMLNKNKWNISQTAEYLGIQRSQLYHKIEQYGIKKDA